MTRRLAGGIGIAGHVLLRVNLLVQSDHQPHPEGKTSPTNPDIESLWYRTLDRHQALHPTGLPAAPPCQKDEQGGWRPFRPLWHCRHVDRFGHALCPDCGRGLELCRDDGLLGSAGLAEYSSSCSRYLYCTKCAANGPLRFYASGGPRSDRVGDVSDLAAGFGRLLTRSDLQFELPCVGCPEAGQCFGPQQLVLKRMHPVCFYPFYLVIQPAPAFDAEAFRALEGSGQLAETESGIGAINPAHPTPPQEILNSEGSRPQLEALPGAASSSRTSDDVAIAAIVAGMLREWPPDPVPAGNDTPPHVDEEAAETIVLPPQPHSANSPLKNQEPGTDIEQTVVLRRQGASGVPASDLEATVLLGGAPPAEPPPAADLTETVVLSAPGHFAGPGPEVARNVDSGPLWPADEELEKTVLLTPASPSGGAKRTAPQEPAEVDLEATVVLKPGTSKPLPRKP